MKRCDLMRRTVEENLKDYCVMRALGYDFELGEIKEKYGERVQKD